MSGGSPNKADKRALGSKRPLAACGAVVDLLMGRGTDSTSSTTANKLPLLDWVHLWSHSSVSNLCESFAAHRKEPAAHELFRQLGQRSALLGVAGVVDLL